MLTSLVNRISVVAALALVVVAFGATTADAARSAASYSVSANTLCKSFHAEGSRIRCVTGYATSNGKLVKYQAKVYFDAVDRNPPTVMRDNSRSSCKSVNLTFWGSVNKSDFSARTSIVSVNGTKSSTSRRNDQAVIAAQISKGPFRVSVTEHNYSEGYVYLTGSAKCSTKDGRA